MKRRIYLNDFRKFMKSSCARLSPRDRKIVYEEARHIVQDVLNIQEDTELEFEYADVDLEDQTMYVCITVKETGRFVWEHEQCSTRVLEIFIDN